MLLFEIEVDPDVLFETVISLQSFVEDFVHKLFDVEELVLVDFKLLVEEDDVFNSVTSSTSGVFLDDDLRFFVVVACSVDSFFTAESLLRRFSLVSMCVLYSDFS